MTTLDRGDATIWWEAEGEGPPLLLIMGLGYSSDMWYRLLPHLTPRYRVIRFDNRGVGRTGVPPGPYTVEMMAADAAAVLDAASETSAHVMGASLGGIIAQELALSHPERVRSLVLGCTTPGGTGGVPPEPEALSMMLARSTMTPEEAAEVAVPFVYAAGTPRARVDEDVAVRMVIPTDPVGYTHQVQAAVAFGGTLDRLPSLSVPTLVLSGRQDRLVPPANAELLAEVIPDAKLVLLEGASHIFFTDQEEAAAAAIRAFLDDVSSR